MERLVQRCAAIAALAALSGACTATVDREEVATAGEAYTPMPEGICTLRAGSDPASLSGNDWPSSHAVYPGSDPAVLAFQSDAYARGGSGVWWVSGWGPGSWLAIDTSNMSASAGEQLALDWADRSPVFAGYFECTWLWGDFELPRGKPRPYVPTRIVAFDPNCTKIHCSI